MESKFGDYTCKCGETFKYEEDIHKEKVIRNYYIITDAEEYVMNIEYMKFCFYCGRKLPDLKRELTEIEKQIIEEERLEKEIREREEQEKVKNRIAEHMEELLGDEDKRKDFFEFLEEIQRPYHIPGC